MRQARVRQDILFAARQHPELVAWQEFWEARYRRALRNNFPSDRYGHFAPEGPLARAGTVITYDKKRFDYRASGQFKLHGTVPFVCGPRYGRWVRLWDRHTRQMIVFVSVHPTPAAFNKKRFGAKKRAKIRAKWEEGMINTRRFVAAQIRSGRTVIIGGDFNANHANVVKALGGTIEGAPVKVRTSAGTDIDHIITVGDTRILGYWTGKGQNSDHPPFAMVFRLGR